MKIYFGRIAIELLSEKILVFREHKTFLNLIQNVEAIW